MIVREGCRASTGRPLRRVRPPGEKNVKQVGDSPLSSPSVRDPGALARSKVCIYTFLKYKGSLFSCFRSPGRRPFIPAIESMLVGPE